MTTMDLRAVFFHEANTILDDKDLLRKVVVYIRNLKKNAETDDTISKEEILAGIREGLLEL